MPSVDIQKSYYSQDLCPIPIYSAVPSDASLIIDFGSGTCRAGWSHASTPSMAFDNYLQKFQQKGPSGDIIYGLGSSQPPNSNCSKLITRTAFDSFLVSQFEVMELTMDGIFSQLGLQDYPLDRPIVMTETLCNPHLSRAPATELLFEGYGASKVSYGCDALFSYYQNSPKPQGVSASQHAMVLSSGNLTTFLLPIVQGQLDKRYIKRLSIGGQQMTDYFLKLMQFKYPTFPIKMSFQQAQNALRNYAYVAEHYVSELKQYEALENYTDERYNVALQFPFSASPVLSSAASYATPSQRAEEEERLNEKKNAFRNKMKEIAEQKRLEKLAQLESEVNGLIGMKERRSLYADEDEYLDMLKSYGYKNAADLEATLKEFEEKLERVRNKVAGIEEPTKEKTVYNFDILNVPDAELAEDQIKEKRRLRLIKVGMEAREKQKAEKEEEKRKQDELALEEEKRRLENPELWLQEKRHKRLELLERQRRQQKLRESLNDRRSFASTQRIKSLSSLAGQDESPMADSKRKRKRASNANANESDDDGFGEKDSDWSIYRDLSREEDSELEDVIENELRAVEELLMKHDPDFWQLELEQAEKPNVFQAFKEGPPMKFEEDSPEAIAHFYQLQMNVERVRVPETLFQPSLMGVESAGIVELIDDCLRRYTEPLSAKIVKDVFLTGGNFYYPGLQLRLENELRAILPFQTEFQVRTATHPLLDAWKGAAAWASTQGLTSGQQQAWMTKKDYEEEGYERLVQKLQSFFFVN